MAGAKFGEAQRQIAVAFQALVEHLNVAGAVHRFNGKCPLFAVQREHIVAKFVGVAGALPEREVDNLRRFNLLIAVLALRLAHVRFNGVVDAPAVGVPKHRAGRLLLHMEKVELFTQLAVVALLRLGQPVEVGFQLFRVAPGGAVNALQHGIVTVAAPIGAGHFGQLERLQLARGGHVGAATEVDKIALAVEANGLVVGD